MKQVLTAQIAHKYAGCRVKLPLVDVNLKITEIGIKHSEFTLMNNAGDHFHASISDCQLILWRLEDISDEDAITLQKIFNPDYPKPLEAGKRIAMDFKNGELFGANMRSIISAMDFLRASEHNGKPKPAYDLDWLIGSCAVDGKLLTV